MHSVQGQSYQAASDARFAVAARHSRRVRILRKAVPAAVLVALLVIALASIFNPFRILAKLPLEVDNLVVSGTRITMESPHLAGFLLPPPSRFRLYGWRGETPRMCACWQAAFPQRVP